MKKLEIPFYLTLIAVSTYQIIQGIYVSLNALGVAILSLVIAMELVFKYSPLKEKAKAYDEEVKENRERIYNFVKEGEK